MAFDRRSSNDGAVETGKKRLEIDVIEAVMYMALGFCTASLIGLAIFPAFYRRAARLTEEALRAVNPSSYAEVRAAQDQVRALHAVELTRVQHQLESEREKAAGHLLEASKLKAGVEELKRSHKHQIAGLEDRISLLEGDQRANDLLSAEVKTLKQKLADTEKALAESWTGTTEDGPGKQEIVQEQDDSGLMPAGDTIALATITGLEAEVATLKAKLARYEPTVATEVEAERDLSARSELAELEAQLIDVEANYVAAQAEVTRLSLVLDAANIPEGERQKGLDARVLELSNRNAWHVEDLKNKERALQRMTGQMQKLRQDLEDAPAVAGLRQDMRSLVARVSDQQTISLSNGARPDDPLHVSSELVGPPQEQTEAVTLANGSKPETANRRKSANKGAGDSKSPARTNDIASAAEALVSRIVASGRNKTPQEAEKKPDTPGESQSVAPQVSKTRPKPKNSKQKKQDVA